jgi:Domain of unknown function (DUF5668)
MSIHAARTTMTEPTNPTDSPAPPPSPPYAPPPRTRHDREPNASSIVIGIVLVAIGAWYFLDQTLGFAMPRINWRDFWPVILIAIGGLMIFRSMDRPA